MFVKTPVNSVMRKYLLNMDSELRAKLRGRFKPFWKNVQTQLMSSISVSCQAVIDLNGNKIQKAY